MSLEHSKINMLRVSSHWRSGAIYIESSKGTSRWLEFEF
jgi:hypothetical protein